MRAEVLTVFQIILQDAIFNCLIVAQSRDWDFLSKNKDLSMSVNSKANDFKVILGIHPWTLKLCFCLLLFCCFFLCYLISFNPLSKIKQGCLKIEKFIFNTVHIWFKFSYVDLFLRMIRRGCRLSTAWKMSKYGVFSGVYFSVFGLNTVIYSLNLHIQSK